MKGLEFRKICVDYHAELIFGLVLGLSVLLSNSLAYLIPNDFYAHTLYPVLHGCIAATSLFGAIVLFRHHEGVHVRILWTCTLLVWTALSLMLMVRMIAYDAPFDAESTETTTMHASKILKDGYVFILRDGHVFTLFGQQIR